MEERDPQTHAIIGAAMEVHNELGPGFLESVYQKALIRELHVRGIPVKAELELAVYYKGEPLGANFRVDLLCYDEVVVELKASRVFGPTDEAQLIHYLTATGMRRGLLINFGAERLLYKRRVRDYLTT
jgi:GxxExxY protein